MEDVQWTDTAVRIVEHCVAVPLLTLAAPTCVRCMNRSDQSFSVAIVRMDNDAAVPNFFSPSPASISLDTPLGPSRVLYLNTAMSRTADVRQTFRYLCRTMAVAPDRLSLDPSAEA
jgi:hypothetical protein